MSETSDKNSPLSDEELDQLMEDPEFVSQLEHVKPRKKARSGIAFQLAYDWTVWTKASIVSLACFSLYNLYYAAEIHRGPLSKAASDVLWILNVRHGSNLLDTLIVRLWSPSALIAYLLLLVACWVYLQPSKALSRVGFWLLIPLIMIPRLFLWPIVVIWTLTRSEYRSNPYLPSILWDSSLVFLKFALMAWASVFLSGKVVTSIWPTRKPYPSRS